MVFEVIPAILGPLLLIRHPKSRPFTPIFSCTSSRIPAAAPRPQPVHAVDPPMIANSVHRMRVES
jgi:hypothetical protein